MILVLRPTSMMSDSDPNTILVMEASQAELADGLDVEDLLAGGFVEPTGLAGSGPPRRHER